MVKENGKAIALETLPEEERKVIEAAVQKARDMGDFVGPHSLYRWNGEIVAVSALQVEPRMKKLARLLHESGRRAVNAGMVVNKLGKPFQGWDEIDEDARTGRLMMAYDLMCMVPELRLSQELIRPEGESACH